jgi:hypothetical protein
MRNRTPRDTQSMAEPPGEPMVEEKPGTGIDRTLIQNMLALTPAERVKLMIEAAHNLAEFLAKARRL